MQLVYEWWEARKDVCILFASRYIETVMCDTSNVGMQSCTKSCCYAIEYSVHVEWPKAADFRYKIMKRLKLLQGFKA